MRATRIVPADHGETDSERLIRLTASLRRRCSELIDNLERSRAHSRRVYESARELHKSDLRAKEFRERFRSLTERQRDVLERISRGDANKVIAFDLQVSQKTVETHRARLMRKLHAQSFAELIRCYVTAFGLDGHMPPAIRRASRRVSPRLAKAAGDDA